MANLLKQKKYHFIYKTTNLINGKYYIGMHSTNDLKDGYLGSGKYLWYSIRKYGKENFKCEILEHLNNRDELSQREKEIITEDLIKDPLCMNLKLGGRGGNVGVNGEHLGGDKFVAANKYWERNKDRKALLAQVNTKKYWEKLTKEERKNKLQKRELSFKNRQHTEETKKLQSIAKKGKYKGVKNSQHGTCWIYNINLKESKKIKKGELVPEGWLRGRKIKFD